MDVVEAKKRWCHWDFVPMSDRWKLQFPVWQRYPAELEGEYPLGVAGLDVPQARIYGRRLGDSIRSEMSRLFGGMKI